MSMDFERNRSNNSVTETENPAFAVTPVWERRGKKRGGFGRKAAPAAAAPMVAPEPRSFASERDYDEPMALDTPIDQPTPRPDYVHAERPVMTPRTTAEEDVGMVAPIGRPTARADRGPKSKGIGPAAIAAGVVALGALGAVGWIASRSDDGIPEIAPGPAAEVADAGALPPVLPPAPPVADTAVNPLPAEAAPAPRATVRSSQPVRTAQARTRPAAAAAAPSAGETGIDASTTAALPSGPQPYSTLNPGATPPPVNPAPTQAASPPTEAPAIPQTAPTLPTETTPPTDPAPETTVTPPTA